MMSILPNNWNGGNDWWPCEKLLLLLIPILHHLSPPLNNSFFMQLFFFPSSPQNTVVKHIDKQTKNGPRKRKVRQWLNSRSTVAFCNNRSHPSQACFFKAYQQANTRKEPCSLLENPTQLRHAKVLSCEDCTHLFMVDSSITTLPLPAWNGEDRRKARPPMR